jgi:hypothetical protein
MSSGDNGWPVTAHPVLEEAREVAGRWASQDWGAVIYRPRYEDAVGVAALALVEGVDADAAVRAFLQEEASWAWRTVQLQLD